METIKISDYILVNNHQFIICNKPVGLPTQEDKTGDASLLKLAEIYCKSTLYPIHRIDRPASGLVIMAKKPDTCTLISTMLRDGRIEKTYIAVVKNKPPKDEDELVHYLIHDTRMNKARVGKKEDKNAKEAIMKYKLIGSSDNYHFLSVNLLTGRHHQIRAQLAAIGCPIKGDVKYGDRRANADRSIHLHAWKLLFKQAVHQNIKEVTAPFPEEPLWDFLKNNILNQ